MIIQWNGVNKKEIKRLIPNYYIYNSYSFSDNKLYIDGYEVSLNDWVSIKSEGVFCVIPDEFYHRVYKNII